MATSTAQFSALVELIYQCATDPERWVDVLAALCAVTRCYSGTIIATDLVTRDNRLFRSWNFGDDVLQRLHEFSGESAKVWQTLPGFWFRDLDEPGTSSREAPTTYGESRWATEVMQPMGIIDSLHLILLRDLRRVADIALFRHQSHGLVTDEDVQVLRLLAPHLRRAAEISDLLEMRSLESAILRSTLDELSAAVIVVDDSAIIRFANAAANAHMAGRHQFADERGRLVCVPAQYRREFSRALGRAQSGEPATLQFSAAGQSNDVAHIVPLKVSSSWTIGNLVVVILSTSQRLANANEIEAIGHIFELTAAELRLLPSLLTGATLHTIADDLGLSEATVKTQRMSIFAKTGVSHRSELTALVVRFLSPLGH